MKKQVRYVLKSFVPAAALLICGALLLGMGGQAGDNFPVPDIDFHATVIDERNITTECTNVSWEGEVFFKATRGEATVTIPFEKVHSIKRLTKNGGGTIDFRVTLKDGGDVTVTFDEESRFFGSTDFGTYRITAKNIREAVFN